MHICHLSTVHRSDDVRIFQKQCRSLVENGFEVTFIVPDSEDRVEGGVKVLSIKREMAKTSRVLIQPLRILRKALRVKADIYQFHDYELWGVGLILRLLGKRVVADVHEDVPAQLMQRTWVPDSLKSPLSCFARFVENTLARCMSGVITADEVLAERFRNLNRQVLAIQNYPILVNLPEQRGHSEYIVRSLGGVFDERCAKAIIEAAQLAPSAMFEIGGGIASTYSDLSWQTTNCSYLGRIPQSEIYQHYVDSDVLIIMFSDAPNHQDIKSNRLFESMYAGKPIVVSNLPKWEKFIETHRCGLVVDPESPHELAIAIQYIQEHQQEAAEMAQRGQAAVMKEYSWNSQVFKLVEFHNRITEK